MATRRYRIDWKNLDWSKATSDLAEEIGCSVQTICTRRARHAPETLNEYRRHNWASFDWSKTNRELAQTYDIHQSQVALARKRYGYPPAKA